MVPSVHAWCQSVANRPGPQTESATGALLPCRFHWHQTAGCYRNCDRDISTYDIRQFMMPPVLLAAANLSTE